MVQVIDGWGRWIGSGYRLSKRAPGIYKPPGVDFFGQGSRYPSLLSCKQGMFSSKNDMFFPH